MTKPKPLRTVPASHPFEPPLRRTALALLIAACFNAAHANPVAPQVVHGQATFNQQGNLFTITNTPNTIINWQSFSVNAGEITRFVQQNAGSSVLNRITGQDPSKILGSLQSNGKVFLINPNGVLFGRDARVDVAGLVASSLALSNQDFLAGKMSFKAGDTAGAVINQGAINAGSGGQILLIAPNVENSGIITAPNGDVLLAAGHSVQLADAANPDLRVVLSAPADQAINIGQVVAQGGRIGMAGALLNQRGVLNANSAVVGENGKIVLKASGKTLLENGSVTSATSAVGKGGEITVLGDQVGMQGNASVDASGALGGGTVLLGGDYQGKNPAIVNARQVAVGKDATIAADALENGDGGKVIVWGNETARVFGSISARGGAASGNGGLVETSGRYLAVDGIRVDTSARRGKRGNWLLDPYDIEVVSGYNGQLQSVDQFADEPLIATIGADTISNAGSNVILQATHRINFNSAINMVNSGAGLTAQAGEAINVNAAITTIGGAVNLSANDAAGGMAYGASGSVNLNAAISTDYGDVTLSGASILGAGTVNVGNGSLSLKSNLAGGSIALSGTGDQLVGSGAEGQSVRLQADNISFTGGLNFGGAGGLATLTIKQLNEGRQIDLGSKTGTALGLTNDELNRVAVHNVTIGDASSGNITISAPVNLVNQQDVDGIKYLNLETGGALVAANKLAMHQVDSELNVTAASLTVGNGGGLSADASVSLTADNMSLGGSSQSIRAGTGTGTGTVSLNRRSNSGSIEIGSAGADSADSLGLTESELKTVGASTIAIGNDNYTGALNLQGALDLSNSNNLNLLQLRTGGNINLNGAVAVANGLTVAAGSFGSDRVISANGIVSVGGAFILDGGSWVQNNASLPAFSAYSFNINNGSFLRVKGGNGDAATRYQIADVYGLQGIGTQSYNKHYSLVANIDASGTANWNRGDGRTGFAPMFSGDDLAYAGTFDGGNHSISGLTINGGVNPPYFGSGLFARLQGGTIRNLAMVGGSVVGGNNVGAVAGNNGGGTISNVTSSMTISGNTTVGGLVGFNSGTISNATATGAVTGLDATYNSGYSTVGGLVGNNSSSGTITVARAMGAVNAPGGQVGGLVGNNNGAIAQAYATGSVDGGADVGGLVGRNGGTIGDAYATGAIRMVRVYDIYPNNLGGVIGWSVSGSSASRLYFSGTVSSNNATSGTVGAVVGRADPGAGVGPALFNYETSGTYFDQGGSTGRSTADMSKQSSFGGFNFGDNAVWRIYEGHTTPLLKAFLTPLQVTAGGASSRVYDGQVASVGPLSYVGLLNGDLGASGTATYGDARNVGTYALGGLWSTQYDISYAGATSVSITPRALSVILSGSKVYDGELGFANVSLSLDNVVSGDYVSVAGTAAQFLDKNAGTDKPVTVSGLTILTGNELGNYSLADTVTGTADITRATLALSNVSAANKIYDGNTTASISGNLTGVIGSDQVQLTGLLGSFNNKNVGAAKDVSYSVTESNLSGNDAGNYVLATGGSTSATITARTLNLGFAGVNKTYDGNAAATLTITDDRVANDVLTATASGAFADKNAAANKAITVENVSLSGTDAGNYVLASTTGATSATITQRALTLGFAAAGKTYDGKTDATVSVTDNRVTGDVLTATATGSFADKNVGVNKVVTVENASLSGTDAGNYLLDSTTGATNATITQRTLALGFTAVGKTYDGNTAATVAVTDNRVTGDVLTATASGSFADKNAGINKVVTVESASLSGTDAANYVLDSTTGATSATITQRALSLGFTAAGKTYDGNTAATVAVTDNRVTGDVLTATASGSFADKNAGANKVVTVQNASLSGTDAANYVLDSTTGATSATIAQRALALGFTAAGKTYDGNTAATVAVTDDRVAGDVLTVVATGAFADKNAGANKVVTVQNASLSGTDAANYVLTSTTGATSATITQRALALGFTAAGKSYDGNTAATVSVTDNRVTGDVLTATATGSFADKNAGTNKVVTVENASLSGTDAANYVLTSTTGETSAAITQRALSLGFTAAGKTYDGNTAAAVAVTDNRVAGDVLMATASGSFADKNAGINKVVTVENASLSGTDAANYVLDSTSGATSATITQRALALGFTAAGKTYDGNTAATVAVTDNRVTGDVLTATASGSFADKNAGINKVVTVENASLSSTDAANYVLDSTTGATSATITQRALALGFTAAGKTYDGNTAATVAVTDNRVTGDVLTATASGSFADKNAGIYKVVTVDNASLSGTDAANYVLESTSGATSATITQRALSLGFTAAGKTYDGNTAATVSVTDNRVTGDVLTATASGSFADKNAGINKVVTVENASLSGTDAANYVLDSTTGATSATITQRALALGFTAAGKTYDGNTAATVAVTDNRVTGDVLTATATGAFADKNAGANKVVTVQNASLSGADAANYVLDSTTGATSATIAQRALILGFTGNDKVYDGGNTATVAIADNRLAGDVLNVSASAAFADKNAGSGKTVTVSNASLSGTDAGNYTLAASGGATTASIARAALTLSSISASDKVYDGTQAASVSGTVAGVIGQDAVSLAGGSGVFADRNFGTGKAVAVSGFQLAGSDAGNYTLTTNSGVAQASIAQRALSTWIGASGGLWSDAANWEGGVAPSGSNVLAADFAASTGTVVYTAAAGDTVLNSFTSRGGLNLTGGSLLVNGAFSAANYAQSGGLLGGSGNVTISNSFSQSAGAINVGGNLAISQASGDLRFAALAANAISLTASTGAISQSGAVVANSLATQSQSGTVLNDAGNRLKSFSATNSGAGGIALTTTSAPDVLVLGSLATGAGDVRIESTGGVESHAITSGSGNVTLIAHSPVNVQGAISANDVTIDASTGVSFGDGARVNAARTVAVTAGTGVTFAGAATLDVLATGGINVLARNGDLTAADTVRINSRGAPVTLLAPNGRLIVPASVMVAVPVTTPVVPPSAVTIPGNAVASLTNTYNPLNQISTPNSVSSPLLANMALEDSTKKATNESKNGIKKTYCN